MHEQEFVRRAIHAAGRSEAPVTPPARPTWVDAGDFTADGIIVAAGATGTMNNGHHEQRAP